MVLNIFAGEVPKQVKVKKLKNLKTLDSKPGNTSLFALNLNLTVDSFKKYAWFAFWLYTLFVVFVF